MNDLLRAKKIVYLNDAYGELGFKPSKAGAIVGWVYDKDGMEGDNYIRIRKKVGRCPRRKYDDGRNCL